MSDETNVQDPADPQATAEALLAARARRTRSILATVLGLLFLLLLGLGYFIVRTLTPVGAPTANDVTTGLTWVRSIYGYGPAVGQQFFYPTDAAFAPDGTIWGTDPQRARVLGFNPDGSFKGMIHTGPSNTAPHTIGVPAGVAVGPDGDVYIADYENQKVIVFTPDNRFVREWSVPVPTDLAVKAGRVYITSVYGVAITDLNGNVLKTVGKRGRGLEEFDTAHGIAVADDGTFYVSDTQNHRVKAYDKNARLLWATAMPAAGADAKSKQLGKLDLPSGMTLDGKGRIVLADPFNFDIQVLDPAQKGKAVATYGKFGTEDGSFAYPTTVDYDPTHDWFVVADTNNSRLQIVRLPGTAASPVAAAFNRALIGPIWICAIPLVLLLLAIVVAIVRRRQRRKLEEQAAVSSTSAESAD